MGLCASSLSDVADPGAIDTSKKIDVNMAADFRDNQSKVKLLLLGAGESGKSTVLKQMKLLYANGFEDTDRVPFRYFIWLNLLETLKVLCEGVQLLQLEEQISATEEFNMLLNVSLVPTQCELTPAMGSAMVKLWSDPVYQRVWELRSQFQVIDSVPTYLQRIREIASPAYIPTDEDILLARVRSTGVTEAKFVIDSFSLIIYDVGGQRNERKKWIHCFDEVDAVIFVAALSEFDQKLFEDNATNRLIEAIALFDEICNSRWFVSTDMILFLNKDDLFREKIRRVNVRTIPEFEDYTGSPYSYEEGMQYFLARFTVMNKNPGKDIYHHVTCGIDTQNFAFVFSACKEIIFKQQLGELMFVN